MADAERRIHLRLLAAPRLELPGGAVQRLAPKDAALLALLALEGATERSHAAALLWPQVDTETARSNLRQRLFRLRRSAGTDLVTPGELLQLTPAAVHDLGDPAPALEADAQALAGELLGGMNFDAEEALAEWLARARRRWAQQRADALARLADAAEAREQIATALRWAERLAADEPLQEHATRRLMRLHYRRGDRSAAVAAYERLKAALDGALGETPSEETRRLAALIDAGDATLPVASAPPPVSILRPPRLVGREEVIEALVAAWQDGRPTLVRAEAGMGKSRLLEEVGARLPVVLHVKARPVDRDCAYAFLARWAAACLPARPAGLAVSDWAVAELARLLPGWGDPSPWPVQPVRLRQALVQALSVAGTAAASSGPGEGVSFLLDDLQDADDESLTILGALLTEEGLPAHWILAARPDERSDAWWQALCSGSGVNALTVDLPPLTPRETEQLLNDLRISGIDAPRWALRLCKACAGRPLFMLEALLATLRRGGAGGSVGSDRALQIPASLRELLRQRLAALEAGALKLVRIAAVAGPCFSLELAAKVLEQHPLDLATAWRALEEAHILVDGQFVHDTLAEAVAQDLPAPVAAWLHLALARHGPALGLTLPQVAAHCAQGGDLAQAARLYLEAGTLASEAGRVDESLDCMQRAADCARAAGDRALAFDALRWRSVELLTGRAGEAPHRSFDMLLETAADDFERGEALRMRTLAWVAHADYAQAADCAGRAIAHFDVSTHPDAVSARLFALNTLSVALARSGQCESALASSDAVAAGIDALGDVPPNLLFGHLAERANVLQACDRRLEALALVERALTRVRALGDLRSENSLLRIGVTALLPQGRGGEALRWAARAEALHQRMGAVHGVALVDRMHLGWACRDQGEFGPAIGWLQQAQQALQATGLTLHQMDAGFQLALTWQQLGRTDLAARALAPLPAGAPPQAPLLRGLHEAWLAAGLCVGDDPGPRVLPFASRLQQAAACELLRSHERMAVRLLLVECLPGEAERVEAWRSLQRECAQREMPALLILAQARQALTQAAAEPARQVLLALETLQPLWVEAAAVAWAMWQVLGVDAAPATRIRPARAWADGLRRIQAGALPEGCDSSFVQRNPVHERWLSRFPSGA
jgi:DNA-binding SARP family transcriptional activator